YQAEQQAHVVSELAQLPADAIVLDIRAPEETELKPLSVDGHQVIELPFFRLASQFGNLDQSKQYYCYCERGVMSRLQAVVLQEQGFKNVSVYRP
ncbi:MAG TPA: thiazole biosynthesis protein, partial [Rheinheimera sp.]|nr:thiazole biosynthesis protein [Rheinheimera sp.]